MPDRSEHPAEVLGLDLRDHKRRVSVELGIELVECLDAGRGGASRSDYVAHVRSAATERLGRTGPTPGRPSWSPSRPTSIRATMVSLGTRTDAHR